MDEKMKAEGLAALEAMGLTASDAVRLPFHRVVADQAFPLEPKAPNAETRAAMNEADEIIAAHRQRWNSNDDGDVDTRPTPDRRREPNGPNAETLAAMREAEEIMAAHRGGRKTEK
jgi:DNA-damage-inducible protein J